MRADWEELCRLAGWTGTQESQRTKGRLTGQKGKSEGWEHRQEGALTKSSNLTEGQGKNKEDPGRKPGLRSRKGLRSTMLGERQG